MVSCEIGLRAKIDDGLLILERSKNDCGKPKCEDNSIIIICKKVAVIGLYSKENEINLSNDSYKESLYCSNNSVDALNNCRIWKKT